MNLKKCNIFTKTIYYMGHVICPRRPENASHTTDSIKNQKAPSTVTKLKSFQEIFTVFAGFEKNFARTASPLYEEL